MEAATAETTCENAARSWVAVDTQIDTDPTAARHRAAEKHGTGSLQQATSAAEPTRPTAEWRQLAARQAMVVPAVAPYIGDPPPPPSASQRYAATTLQRHAVAADGHQWRLSDITVYCTLTRGETSTDWRVDTVETDLHPGPGR